MPIDPQIPLSVQPPRFNSPFEVLAQMQQVRDAQAARQQQMQSAKALEDQRREAADKQRREAENSRILADAYRQSIDPQTGEVNRKVLTSTLANAGLGQAIPDLMKGLDEADEANTKAKKAKRDFEDAETGYAKVLGGQIIASDFNPAIVNGLFEVAKSHGHDVGLYEKLFTEQPDQFKTFVHNLVNPPAAPTPFTLGAGQARYDKDGKLVASGPEAAPSLQHVDALVNGKPAKVNFNPKTGAYTDQAGQPVADVKPIPPASAGAANQTGGDAKSIAEAIAAGDQPPTVTGLYRLAGPVRAELARLGYDMSRANLDWEATKKHVLTLNGQQQTRFRQAIDTAIHSVDVIDALADQWKGGKFPILNKANLAAAKNGAYGQQAASIATQLEGQITDVTSELGQVFMGGNSPTDHALQLAEKNLKAEWSEKVLRDMTKLARTNLTIRANSVKNVGIAGASEQNPYAPQSAPATQEAKPGTLPPVSERKVGVTEATINGVKMVWAGTGWRPK